MARLANLARLPRAGCSCELLFFVSCVDQLAAKSAIATRSRIIKLKKTWAHITPTIFNVFFVQVSAAPRRICGINTQAKSVMTGEAYFHRSLLKGPKRDGRQ